MAIQPVKVGLIGAGMISYTYLENLIHTFGITEVVGISDLIEARSQDRARRFGIRQMTNEEIYGDPEIEIVVNLTYPTSHLEVSEAALRAGKHVHSEKLMGVNYREAQSIYALAKEKGLRFGAAPDTFLGGALQTARKLIDAGLIGVPITAQAMVNRGYRISGAEDVPLRFGYGPGGSMPYDMSGYYVNAMVSLLGPIKRVTGFERAFCDKKMYENPRHPKYKTFVDFKEPNLLTGSLEFHCGCLGSLTTMGECHLPEVPRLEVYGTEGTLILPDPNHFDGKLYLKRAPSGEPCEMPLTHGFTAPLRPEPPRAEDQVEDARWARSCRGIGVADMAWAIRNNRPHRCSAELALHDMEVVHGIIRSSRDGQVYTMTTRPGRPEPLPPGYVTGTSMDEACLDAETV